MPDHSCYIILDLDCDLLSSLERQQLLARLNILIEEAVQRREYRHSPQNYILVPTSSNDAPSWAKELLEGYQEQSDEVPDVSPLFDIIEFYSEDEFQYGQALVENSTLDPDFSERLKAVICYVTNKPDLGDIEKYVSLAYFLSGEISFSTNYQEEMIESPQSAFQDEIKTKVSAQPQPDQDDYEPEGGAPISTRPNPGPHDGPNGEGEAVDESNTTESTKSGSETSVCSESDSRYIQANPAKNSAKNTAEFDINWIGYTVFSDFLISGQGLDIANINHSVTDFWEQNYRSINLPISIVSRSSFQELLEAIGEELSISSPNGSSYQDLSFSEMSLLGLPLGLERDEGKSLLRQNNMAGQDSKSSYLNPQDFYADDEAPSAHQSFLACSKGLVKLTNEKYALDFNQNNKNAYQDIQKSHIYSMALALDEVLGGKILALGWSSGKKSLSNHDISTGRNPGDTVSKRRWSLEKPSVNAESDVERVDKSTEKHNKMIAQGTGLDSAIDGQYVRAQKPAADLIVSSNPKQISGLLSSLEPIKNQDAPKGADSSPDLTESSESSNDLELINNLDISDSSEDLSGLPEIPRNLDALDPIDDGVSDNLDDALNPPQISVNLDGIDPADGSASIEEPEFSVNPPTSPQGDHSPGFILNPFFSFTALSMEFSPFFADSQDAISTLSFDTYTISYVFSSYTVTPSQVLYFSTLVIDANFLVINVSFLLVENNGLASSRFEFGLRNLGSTSAGFDEIQLARSENSIFYGCEDIENKACLQDENLFTRWPFDHGVNSSSQGVDVDDTLLWGGTQSLSTRLPHRFDLLSHWDMFSDADGRRYDAVEGMNQPSHGTGSVGQSNPLDSLSQNNNDIFGIAFNPGMDTPMTSGDVL